LKKPGSFFPRKYIIRKFFGGLEVILGNSFKILIYLLPGIRILFSKKLANKVRVNRNRISWGSWGKVIRSLIPRIRGDI